MNNAATDGGIYANGRTYAEHCAWIEGMSDDERTILYTPVGHRWTLVVISEAKRLLSMEMSAEHRIRFLEFLDTCTDHVLSAEAIAAVEPVCDQAWEMVKEARKLGASKALDIFAELDVFNAFVALNPSLLTAIKMGKNEYRFDRLAS